MKMLSSNEIPLQYRPTRVKCPIYTHVQCAISTRPVPNIHLSNPNIHLSNVQHTCVQCPNYTCPIYTCPNSVYFQCDMGKYSTRPINEPLGEHLIRWTCGVFSHIAWKMNNIRTFSHDQTAIWRYGLIPIYVPMRKPLHSVRYRLIRYTSHRENHCTLLFPSTETYLCGC